MLFVGDDWAEDHHDVEIVDENGKVLKDVSQSAPSAAERDRSCRGALRRWPQGERSLGGVVGSGLRCSLHR
jgi:hypothetical protein